MDNLLVDTGFLVAYGRQEDILHPDSDRFLKGYRGRMFTVAPVIVETCFFLKPFAKRQLLDWVAGGTMTVIDVPVSAYADLSATIGKYANRDLDMADAALVWLAEQSRLRRIVTVDRNDFSLFRLKGGKRFELIQWF